jgi:hypothetical protein
MAGGGGVTRVRVEAATRKLLVGIRRLKTLEEVGGFIYIEVAAWDFSSLAICSGFLVFS